MKNKTKKYAEILTKFITDFEEKEKNAVNGFKTSVIIDNSRCHYQCATYGFVNKKYIFSVLFHFDIIDDKVWVQCNHTDWDFGEDLIKRGILKSDIILGFQPEYLRFAAGYGVEDERKTQAA